MSEVKDVRKVLEKMRASQPFLEGTPAAEVVAALVSEGLAACDEYEVDGRWIWKATLHPSPAVDVFASILRKAGLLQ